MADHYCQTSSFLAIPENKFEAAVEFLEGWEYDIGAVVETKQDERGFIFHGDSVSPDDIVTFVEAIQNHLELTTPFFMSWAYSCSKHRVDEFGGGAVVVQRGVDTYWVDAMQEVRSFYER